MAAHPDQTTLRDRIEEVARSSWPALEEQCCGEWLLRFADGYTRRSNSVYPLGAAPADLPERVATCEAIYRQRGLTPTFRMTAFASPAGLDDYLARCGYQHVTPTHVLYRRLDDWHVAEIAGVTIEELTIDDWIPAFAALSETPDLRAGPHRAILSAITAPHRLAIARHGGGPVACGLAVVAGGLCGIFDVVTAPRRRNRGYGTALMRDLLNWGCAAGATGSYLQVVQHNRPALRLYENLAFGPCYEYWYRVATPVPHPTDSRLRR